MNNLSPKNIDKFSKEMKHRIKENPDIVIWFASFLIYNPVSRDSTFHENYLSVLNKINSKDLYKHIKK